MCCGLCATNPFSTHGDINNVGTRKPSLSKLKSLAFLPSGFGANGGDT